MTTDLSSYSASQFKTGAGLVKRIFWYSTNLCFFKSGMYFPSWYKRFLLRLYGAKVGRGVVIKPSVNIKYPWRLSIGNYSWIGESVWIDNLAEVTIGCNVCISQGAMLLCGNHDYSQSTFDLITGEIRIEDGVWIGARSLVGPGVTLESHSVLAAFSFASSDTEAYKIYRGNPASFVRERKIRK